MNIGIPESLQLASERALDLLMQGLPGLTAGVIASSDGFEVAASARAGVEVSKLAAMASSISAIGAMVGVESEVGQHQSVIIEADHGFIVIIEIPHTDFPMILNLVADRSEVLGQVLFLAKRAVGDLVGIR